MSDGSSIEWLAWPGYRPASWNCIKGCTRKSRGCENCYAEVMAARFSKPGQWGHGIAEMRGGDHRWTGHVELDEAKLLLPLRWRSPRVIFVNSTSDLFHERLPDEAIDRVFAVMALCPQHRFIVLTKRAERMRKYLTVPHFPGKFLTVDDAGNVSDTPHAHVSVHSAMCDLFQACPHGAINAASAWQDEHYPDGDGFLRNWPLSNVIIGVSVEDQETADERIPHLLATPAACRMVSAEPLLGPVDFTAIMGFLGASRADRTNIRERTDALRGSDRREYLRQDGTWSHRRLDDPDGNPVFSTNCGPRLGWIVTGGESGPGARPMHPDWAKSIRDQCQAAGVAYFHKQNGEYEVVYDRDRDDPEWRRCDSTRDSTPKGRWLNLAGGHGFHGERVLRVVPVGKHRAGRLLDGRTHDEVPEVGRCQDQ